MSVPKDFRYTDEHIWAKVDGDRIKIGLTEYAQSDIGEILLVELPKVGKELKIGEKFAVIETAKAISDLKSPVAGTVLEVNQALEKTPELINKEPYRAGWLILLQKAPDEDLGRLMDADQYETILKEEGAL